MSDTGDTNSTKDIPPWLQPVPEAEEEAGLLSGKRGTLIAAGAAVVVLVVFVLAIVFLYEDAPRQEPRRITADTTPIKQKPSEPGGMEVEHRDKQVFEAVNNGGVSSRVELGAQSEQPVAEIPNLPAETTEETMGSTPNTSLASTQDAIGDLAAAATADVKEQVSSVTEPARPVVTPTVEPQTQAQPAPATGPVYRVQLGAYGSEQTATTAWRTARGKFREQLGDLTPVYESVQAGDRRLFRLRVGPLTTRADADQICIALRAQQQACIVVNP